MTYRKRPRRPYPFEPIDPRAPTFDPETALANLIDKIDAAAMRRYRIATRRNCPHD